VSELKQPRVLFGLAATVAGLISIGISAHSKLTGVEEWRPGAHVDSLLLSGAITTMMASGLFLIPAPNPSVAIPTWRKSLGLGMMGASVVLIVWRIVRMG